MRLTDFKSIFEDTVISIFDEEIVKYQVEDNEADSEKLLSFRILVKFCKLITL